MLPTRACANIALIMFTGLLALDPEIAVEAAGAAVAGVGFDEEDEEFAPNNIRISAADKPPKAFGTESMSHLSPAKDVDRPDGSFA